MSTKLWNRFFASLPLLLFTAMLLGLLLVRLLYGMAVPPWGAWGLGIAWGAMAFDYLLQAKLFKQIGGFAVTLLAVLILVGALLPQSQVANYPHVASSEIVQRLESGWTAVFSGNLFQESCVKQTLINYGRSLEALDPFRHGKMILYALLGGWLAIVYLFPLDPLRRFRRRSSSASAVHPSAAFFGSSESYFRRFSLVFLSGTLFALHVELLQVLSPTRLVTFRSFIDCAAGLLVGFALFFPFHLFYIGLGRHRAKGSPRFNVLGIGVDAVNMADCLQMFEHLIEGAALGVSAEEDSGSGRRPAMTTALGVAGIVEARRNQILQRILNESVLNTPDGMPLVWLGKLFGYRSVERVYGPDLLRDACAYGESRGWRHFFYGAAPGIVEKLQLALQKKHPKIQIAGIYCPPFRPLTAEEEADLIAQVASSKPDIFWVGISTPKQLYFMDQMRDKLDCTLICPVGYAFDVNAGVQVDAPDWAKYSGFQWLHRAIKQPRLWKRYLPDNPRFIFEVMLQVLRLRKFPMLLHERIQRPMLDSEGYTRFPAGVVSLSAMTQKTACQRVLNWARTGQRHYVNVCTADTMVQCFDQPQLAKIVKNAGMATTDGMPLVWLAHHYGLHDATRVYGPDLMLEICRAGQQETVPQQHKKVQKEQRSTSSSENAAFLYPSQDETGGLDLGGAGKETDPPKHKMAQNVAFTSKPLPDPQGISHFFYGATDDVLAQLKINLLEKFPNLHIAGMYSPPFRPLTELEKEEVAQRINASGADIVWCGLGTPKQDYWVAEFRPRLNCAAILAVGAAFNFHAGFIRQAPRWMGRSGLEWLFRLVMEPKRLWKRYLIGNPRFIVLILRQVAFHKKRGKVFNP